MAISSKVRWVCCLFLGIGALFTAISSQSIVEEEEGTSLPAGAGSNTADTLGAQVRQPLQIADSLVNAGEHKAAAKVYIELAEAENDVRIAAEYRDAAAGQYSAADQLDSAILLYERNYHLPSEDERMLDSLRARAYHQSGVLYMNAGEAEASYPLFLKAYDLRKSLYPEGHEDLLLSTRNLVIYHSEYASTTDSARIYVDRATVLMESVPEIRPFVKLLICLNIAEVYTILFDRRAVKNAGLMAENIIGENLEQLDPTDIAFAYYDLGTFSYIVTDYESSYKYTQLAYEKLSELGYDDWAAEAKNQIAVALQDQDHLSEAAEIYREVRPIFEAYEDYRALHINHYNVGLIALDQKRFSSAESELAEARRYALLTADSLAIANTVHAMARLDLDRGRLDNAKTGFERSLGMYLPEVMTEGRPDVAAIPPNMLLTLAMLFDDRTDYYVATGDLANASADLDLVFALFDRIRTELPAAESQRFVSQQLRPFFQQGIHLQYLQYREDGDEAHLWAALQLSERAKAFSLLQQRGMAARDRPARERELLERINELERANLEGAEQEGLLAAARLQLRRLQQAYLEEMPEPEPIATGALRAYLSDRSLHLIEYALGEEHSYRFELGPDSSIALVPIQGAGLSTKIEELRQALRAGAFSGPDLRSDAAKASDATYRRIARQLAEVLLPNDLNEKSKLLIIPDGVLGYLPFGALLVDNHSSTDFQSLPYLARERQLHYSYSAQYLLYTESVARPKIKQAILALAPSFVGDTEIQEAQAQLRSVVFRGERAIPGLLPLLHNEAEVRQIAELFPDRTKVLVGGDARREVFMERADRYALIHLSSHALVDPERPELSFVAFSQRGDSLESEELLLLLDLAALDLQAELAVLSACETGIGQIAEGEGVLSLAQAFSTAGAESTLTTLWKVDDAATKALMGEFYTALADGQSRAEALAYASKAAIDGTYAHPYYWSGMSLYGPGDQLALPERPSKLGRVLFWGLMALVCLIIGAAILLRLRTPAKSNS
ncbi:MAG: CHAT domain-containing protein [Bacteroidota bacterium]